MSADGVTSGSLRERLQRLLSADGAVIAAAVAGSLARTDHDEWSDLDLLIVVDESAIERFFPTLAWLQPFGAIFTHEQSTTPFMRVTRVCFADFRRLDCVITTPSALLRLPEWPQIPFWQGAHLLFSRSDAVAQALVQAYAPPRPAAFTDEQFAHLQRRFWFNGVVAVTKVVRGDPLIALHLALDMVRDCCVLAMLVRDRDSGEAIHRESIAGQDFVARLAGTSQPFTAPGILATIEQAALVFDALAGQLRSELRAST